MSVLLRALLSASALGASLLASGAVAQPLVVADGASTVVAFGDQVGRVFTFICPSTTITRGQVWGSDVYDLGSDICTAAVHAGRHTFGQTSLVTLRIGDAADELRGEERSGITSQAWPSRVAATYSFIPNTETGQIDWNTSFDRAPEGIPPLTLRCSPNGKADSRVIGSLVYRADSSICLAGVHAGIITLAGGGLVTVTFQARQQRLEGTTQNGVESVSWEDATYATNPQPYSVGPVEARIAPAGSGRVVRLMIGFAAVGNAPLVEPRRITVMGFAFFGEAPQIVPRLVRVTGFGGVGRAQIVPRSVILTGWTGTGRERN
jgi:hypothetical protein